MQSEYTLTPMTKIEAVIFDADGTLLDTREFIFQALERTLGHHGHAVPSRDVFTSHMGAHLIDMYMALAPDGDVAKLVEHHRELHREELLYLVAAYEGLHELLQHIREHGAKLGICTNRGEGARDLLRQIGILQDFDTVVTADDVKKHKPDPEGLLQALAHIDVAPQHAVMVGDTTADIGAGKAAGVAYTIGLTHGFSTASILRDAGADYVVDHLDGVLNVLREQSF